MSVPKDKRKVSEAEYVNTALDLQDFLNKYCVGKKFVKGNTQDREIKGEKAYRHDLAPIRSAIEEVVCECLYANHLNPEKPEEYWDRRRALLKALSLIEYLNIRIQNLIDKYVVFDKETDKILMIVPNEYFYNHAIELLTNEYSLVSGVLSSDKKRLKP